MSERGGGEEDGGRKEGRMRAGWQPTKLEPHTEMWGIEHMLHMPSLGTWSLRASLCTPLNSTFNILRRNTKGFLPGLLPPMPSRSVSPCATPTPGSRVATPPTVRTDPVSGSRPAWAPQGGLGIQSRCQVERKDKKRNTCKHLVKQVLHDLRSKVLYNQLSVRWSGLFQLFDTTPERYERIGRRAHTTYSRKDATRGSWPYY